MYKLVCAFVVAWLVACVSGAGSTPPLAPHDFRANGTFREDRDDLNEQVFILEVTPLMLQADGPSYQDRYRLVLPAEPRGKEVIKTAVVTAARGGREKYAVTGYIGQCGGRKMVFVTGVEKFDK